MSIKSSYLQNFEDEGNMDKIIKKLCQEKVEYEKVWKEIGYTEGNDAIQYLSFEDFAMLEEDGNSYKEIPSWKIWVEDFVDTIRSESILFCESSYMEGWVAAVLNFWNEIKNKVLT